MGIWDKYKLNDLSEEQRADVIKTIVKETEETNREKLNSSNYNVVRGLWVGTILLLSIPVAIVSYYSMDAWREVRIKSMTPMTCPPPPPCPAAPLPSFDIKVVPAAPPTSSAK